MIKKIQTDPLLPFPLIHCTGGSSATIEILAHPEGSREHRLVAIGGAPPSPARIPSGCAFHPRCRFALESCAVEVPPLVSVNGRTLACPVDPLAPR